MSAKVQGWVWDAVDLLPQRRLILLWLANRATDNGVCFPGQAEVRRKTGLGEKMVRRHLHWLASDRDEDGTPKTPLVTIVERRVGADRNTSNVYVLHVPWALPEHIARELEELKHVPSAALAALQEVGVAGDPQGSATPELARRGGGRPRPPRGSPAGGMGVAGGREEPGHRNTHRETPPSPNPLPAERPEQQRGENERGDRRDSGVPTATLPALEAAAGAMVTAFYRGLGAEPDAVTATIRRRDVTIAGQLVAAGASAAEAEAYARESSTASGRIVPVDLRSFERERLGWLARRRGADASRRHLVDRTGQAPSWEARAEGTSTPGATPSVSQPAPLAPSSVDTTPASNNDLAAKLRGLLLRGDQQS